MIQVIAARLSRIAFLALLVAGAGCHISDYSLITDNNQTNVGGGPGEIRDTRGQAKLVHSSQWAYLMADGAHEALNYVRQNADGSQTLTSHDNLSVEGDATFSDDLYCSPEREGCATRRSFDKDPTDRDEDPFNTRVLFECPAANTLCMSLSTYRYYGECGRTGTLSLQDKLSLWNMGTLVQVGGVEALHYQVDRSNLSIVLENDEGLRTPLQISGEIESWTRMGGAARGIVDSSHPLIGVVARSYAAWVQQHGTKATTITGCYQGICREWTVAGVYEEGRDAPDTVGDILRFASAF
ncbi:hypothetical protein ABI59_23410 [Acidobacteria bacterium Mor1]|nr:hypothetical protein ABI59_23410 [Acidobacteria bacterium Mor1]